MKERPKLNPRQRLFVSRARAHADRLAGEVRRAHDRLDLAVAAVAACVAGVLAAHDHAASHLEVLDGRSARHARARVRAELRARLADRLEEPLSAPRRARGGGR